VKTFPKPLSPGEEKACLERLADGDEEARAVLIERNLRLVAHVAKKYQNTDYDMEDLVSVGTIGLIKAVNTFHPERASRLGTYAAKCIENAILSLICFTHLKILHMINTAIVGRYARSILTIIT
jgi:RNA polymerase sporulation-specific sigma factor